jgi:hypothetical protein
MKKVLIIVVVLAFIVAGCGRSKVIDNVEYETYGLLNSDKMKNDNIEYRLIMGNLIWGIVLIETVIAPVYFFGFSLFEPVGKKVEVIKGQKLTLQ